jgi:hypothetical protein
VSIGAAAQRVESAETSFFPVTDSATADSAHALKAVAAERLAAHRQRRAAEQAGAIESESRQRASAEAARYQGRRGARMVREAVTARYQQSQSYREFLAAEAERALQQAHAEAEVAQRNAAAVAQVQQDLLAELAGWEQPAPFGLPATPGTATQAEIRGELAHELADIVLGAQELMAEPRLPASGITVRLYEDVAPAAPLKAKPARQRKPAEPELAELEQEIEFRRAPEFAELTLETLAIPANIIEFPRQLIAPRKARPRIAEGPLREESAPRPQLRIFEVEPEQIANTPERTLEPAAAAEWQSLQLDAAITPRTQGHGDTHSNLTFQPQAAAAHRRVMAAAVDAVCIGAAFLGFATTIGYIAGPRLLQLNLPALAGTAAAALFFFAIVFQMLFFTFADATPGMRYARIALCTFADDNPSRQSMRRRTLAAIMAACPLGLGFAWIWMDNDRLGWHDRISRMYQRAY